MCALAKGLSDADIKALGQLLRRRPRTRLGKRKILPTSVAASLVDGPVRQWIKSPPLSASFLLV